MRSFLNATNQVPHAEERPSGRVSKHARHLRMRNYRMSLITYLMLRRRARRAVSKHAGAGAASNFAMHKKSPPAKAGGSSRTL
jgi:hypothetical protein